MGRGGACTATSGSTDSFESPATWRQETLVPLGSVKSHFSRAKSEFLSVIFLALTQELLLSPYDPLSQNPKTPTLFSYSARMYLPRAVFELGQQGPLRRQVVPQPTTTVRFFQTHPNSSLVFPATLQRKERFVEKAQKEQTVVY